MSSRPKRKRKEVSYTYDEEEIVDEEPPPPPPAHVGFADFVMPSREERLAGTSLILEQLPDDLLTFFVSFLRAQDIHLVRQLNKHLLERTNRCCRGLMNEVFLTAAQAWLQWDYMSEIPDREEGMVSFRAELAKLTDCWHCGGRCKGIYFPKEWRLRGILLKQKLCLGCFATLNPAREMHSARSADEAYGTDATSRKAVQHCIANIGFRRMKKYYLAEDLQALKDARQ